MAVSGGGMGGLIQSRGDSAKPLFQARKGAFTEARCQLRLAIAIIELLDLPRERVEPFGQTLIDGAVVERIDLAGNVAEERRQLRLLRRALRPFQKQ